MARRLKTIRFEPRRGALRRSAAPLCAAALWLSDVAGARAAEHEVHFEARRVELDPARRQVTLQGNATVTSGRHRLVADRLQLTRTPRGVQVDGAGRVAFCACPDPPVTVGFEGALIAPPTDLVLKQPTLCIASVPVAWAPLLWVRSSDRWGLLPPKLAWRGDDGLLAGLGAHAPLGREESLDVRASGYLLGGIELEGRLITRASTTVARWDHLNDTLFALDARGRIGNDDRNALAWDVDVARGARVARGPLLLEEISLRYDRVRAGASHVGSNVVLGFEGTMDARRGGALDSAGAAGPGAHVGWSGGFGPAAQGQVAMDLHTVEQREHEPLTLASLSTHFGMSVRAGIVGLGSSAHAAGLGVVDAAAERGAAAAGVAGRVAVPFSRAYAGDVEHRLEPFLDAGVKVSRADAPLQPWIHGNGAAIHAGGGLRTTLGSYSSRAGVVATLRTGVVGDPELPEKAASGRVVAEFQPFGMSADAAWLPTHHDVTVIGGARVGALDGFHVAPRVAGRVGASTHEARLLDTGGWNVAPVGWLDRPGWALGLSTGVPWTRWLASGADADVDATAPALVGVRGSTAYRHPCGCLAIVGWAGHRVGRPGVDAMVTFDLAP